MIRGGRRILWPALAVPFAYLLSVFYAPQLLAFPYAAHLGRFDIYAEAPIPGAATRAVLDKAEARLATSPINRPADHVSLFLTNGGWRWRLLSLQSSGAFAVTRVSGAILLNRSSIADDRIENGAAVGGVRPLHQVIAHEETHNLLRARFGPLIDVSAPDWKREGYCDYVGGGGSLSDAEVARLEANHVFHPALVYYHGRKRVGAALAANGGSVDKLFAS